MRAEIAEMPDGVYYVQDHMEDDGVSDAPLVKCHVDGHGPRRRGHRRLDGLRRAGERSDQRDVRRHRRRRATAASSTSSDTTSRSTPAPTGRSGWSRRPAAPVNVKHPGPSVGGNTETHPQLQTSSSRRWRRAVPDRVAAAEGGTACNFLFGGFHPKTATTTRTTTSREAAGAAPSTTTATAIIVNNGNCRNTPVEIFETRYPLRVVEYSLIPDSGGAGRGAAGSARGGSCASRRGRGHRQRRARPDEARIRRLGPRGRRARAGPAPSASSAGATPSSGRSPTCFGTASPSKFTNVILEPGDEVLIDSPGGGGYGDPVRRDRALVARDVSTGVCHAEGRARRDYDWDAW